MTESLADPRKYLWTITDEELLSLRSQLGEARLNKHTLGQNVESYENIFYDIVTIVVGVAPHTYQVKCSEGCLSLLRDALGDPTLL